MYDNLIFVLPSLSYAELYEQLGEPKEELEKVWNYGDVIFWSFIREKYQKTNWWPRTASVGIRDQITIRTANTIRKIASK